MFLVKKKRESTDFSFSLSDTFTWDSQPNPVEYYFAFPFLMRSFFVTHVRSLAASYCCSFLANLERASYLPELSSNYWKPGRLGRYHCEGLLPLRALSGHRLAGCDHSPFGLENASGALNQRYEGLSFRPFGWVKCRDLSTQSASLALRCLSWVKPFHC